MFFGRRGFNRQGQRNFTPGANDVWVVARPGKKDALIPYIDAVVKEINVADQTIKIHIMEGLLDE